MKNIAILLAGSAGKRLGTAVPKQRNIHHEKISQSNNTQV